VVFLSRAKFDPDWSRGCVQEPRTIAKLVRFAVFTSKCMPIKVKFDIVEYNTLRVYSYVANLALIGEGDGYRSHKLENVVKIRVFRQFCCPTGVTVYTE